MINGLKLVFGQDRSTKSIVHISEVSSGKSCNCVCQTCGSLLIAKKGKVKQHHFAHDNLNDCGHGNETFLHIYAKRVIKREKTLTLPRYDFAHRGRSKSIPSRTVRFDEVNEETEVGKYRADAIGVLRGHQLIIEFAVTHPCEEAKEEHFRTELLSALELDLAHAPLDAPISEIDTYILHSSPRHWISNAKSADLAKEIDAKILADEQEQERKRAWKERKNKERFNRILQAAEHEFKKDIPPAPIDTLRFCRSTYKRCQSSAFKNAINRQLKSPNLFTVPSHYWQSSIVFMFIIRKIENEHHDLGFGMQDVYRWISKDEFGFIPELFHYRLPEELNEKLLQLHPNFATPYELVKQFLEELVDHLYLDRNGRGYRVSSRYIVANSGFE